MSDLPPPPVADSPGPTDPSLSLWDRCRALPVWAQILIPVVIIAIVIGIWALATSDSETSSSADTTVVDESSMDNVLAGIIIAGGIRPETTTTTTEVATSSPTTLAPTTLAPTTLAPTTLAPTTVAPTTLAPTTLAPTTTAGAAIPTPTPVPPTTAPATTVAPTTQPPTTQKPTTTTTTTEPAPPTTEGSSSALPSPDDFLAQWNAAAEGTNVPTLSRSQITKIVDGPFAGAFLATLSPTEGNKMAPQVGLIGTMSTTDPTQIAELLLVYISGPDESASDFYWEAFGVLTQAVDPEMTKAQIAALEDSLGREDGLPPFPEDTDNSADSNGFNYNLYTGATREGIPATGIAVT